MEFAARLINWTKLFQYKGCSVEIYKFIQLLKVHSVSKLAEVDSDQSPRSSASDLVLQCLSMPHKMDAWFIWIKPV